MTRPRAVMERNCRLRRRAECDAAVQDHLKGHPGATVGDIALATGWSFGQVIAACKRLEKAGVIEYIGEKG